MKVMSRIIALLSLSMLAILAGLGNFWFTCGIWPKSWWSFVVFGLVSVVLAQLLTSVIKEE